jgi:hypothetical protein
MRLGKIVSDSLGPGVGCRRKWTHAHLSIFFRGLCSALGQVRKGGAVNRLIKAVGSLALGVSTLGATPQTETATFIMTKGYDKGAGIGTATIQDFYLLPDGLSCRHKKRLTGLAMFSGPSITKSVPAGAPLNLYVTAQRIVGYSTGVCQNNITFTPIPHPVYNVVQRTVVWSSCHIEVIDSATNEAPLDLRQDNTLKCVKMKN